MQFAVCNLQFAVCILHFTVFSLPFFSLQLAVIIWRFCSPPFTIRNIHWADCYILITLFALFAVSLLYLFCLAAAQCQSHLKADMCVRTCCINYMGSPFNRFNDKRFWLSSFYNYYFFFCHQQSCGFIDSPHLVLYTYIYIHIFLSLAIWGVNYFLF